MLQLGLTYLDRARGWRHYAHVDMGMGLTRRNLGADCLGLYHHCGVLKAKSSTSRSIRSPLKVEEFSVPRTFVAPSSKNSADLKDFSSVNEYLCPDYVVIPRFWLRSGRSGLLLLMTMIGGLGAAIIRESNHLRAI